MIYILIYLFIGVLSYAISKNKMNKDLAERYNEMTDIERDVVSPLMEKIKAAITILFWPVMIILILLDKIQDSDKIKHRP